MSRWHLERNGFITKSDLPEVSRQRSGSVTASLLLKGNGTNGTQNNTFIDSSANNFTITRNGNVTQGGFTPFLPANAEYDPATHGGSGYFDGTGDFLTAPNNAAFDFGSGDFTIEGWISVNSNSPTEQGIYGKRANNLSYPPVLLTLKKVGSIYRLVYAGSFNGSSWGLNSSFTNGSIDIGLNTWVHIALVRNGSTFTSYVNGVADLTFTGISSSLMTNTNAATIGADATNGNNPYSGYISNFRIVKGTAVYTNNFTPPTAPLTAITNTSLLLNFTNAGIFDSTGKNVLETVGNAQIDTTTKKYGTGSIKFDGNGDWTIAPAIPEYDLGTGNFTIEFWIRLNSLPGGASYPGIVSRGAGSGSLTQWGVNVMPNGAGVGFNVMQSNGVWTNCGPTSTTQLSINTWYHVALVRVGTGATDMKLYIDGVLRASSVSNPSLETNPTARPLNVGRQGAGNTDEVINGFIDDLRIIKGVALYTSNFTPPTAELDSGSFETPIIVTNDIYGVKQLAPVANKFPYVLIKSAESVPLLTPDILLYASFNTTPGATTHDVYSGNGSSSPILVPGGFIRSGTSVISNTQTKMDGFITSAYSDASSVNSGWKTIPDVTANLKVGTSSPISFEFWWYNAAGLSGNFARVISFGGYHDNGSGLEIESDVTYTDTFDFYEYSGSASLRTSRGSKTLATNTWHHIYWALGAGNTSYIGINGVVTSYSNYLSSFSPATQNLALGMIDGGNDDAYRGYYQHLIVRNTIPYTSNFTPTTVPLLDY